MNGLAIRACIVERRGGIGELGLRARPTLCQGDPGRGCFGRGGGDGQRGHHGYGKALARRGLFQRGFHKRQDFFLQEFSPTRQALPDGLLG